MFSPRMTMTPVALACALALSACSSDDAATGTTTTITGVAEAPGGLVAQFEREPSIFLVATDWLFPAAHAAITGLDPVRNATVELIRIDDDGDQVGDVLASTVTSLTGDYSLALPTGVSLAGNLIVRITGTSGASMSAMVVEQAVDINPISQYVLDKFVDDENLVLGDLALNEVVALTNKVEEFDLTATADLTSMLEELEAQVGELVDTEITVLNSTPDDGSAAAALTGAWNTVEFGLGMHDSETGDVGTLTFEVLSEGINMIAGSNPGEINLEIGVSVLIDAWSNFTVYSFAEPEIYHQISLELDGESLIAQIDDGGNIVVEYPFEEDFQTVSIGDEATDPDNDGPDFGWRWPSGSIAINNVDNRTMVFSDVSAGVRYEMIDTDENGINDAINPDAKAGDETEMFLGLMLKQGSGMTESTLSGDYGLVSLSIDLDTTPEPIGSADSSVGVMTFDGAGSVSVAADAMDDYGFTRSAPNLTDVTLTDVPGTDGDFSFPYTITETGKVVLDTDGNGESPQDLEGWSNDDGSVIGLLNVTTEGSGPNQVSKEMAVVVKLPTSAPAMADAVFKLYPIAFGAEESGLTELDTLGSVSSLTFGADAMTATADFTLRGFERATDIAAVEAIVDADEVPFDFEVTLGNNGAIEMSFIDAVSGETNTLKGFVTADGNMMVLRYLEADDTQGAMFRALGMMIAVRQ